MPIKSYRIVYESGSIDDLKNIVSWYNEINPSLKEKIQQSIQEAENILLKNPFAFAKIGFHEFRRIILSRFPYKMVFVIEPNDIIRVFAFLHTRRSNKFVKRRLKNKD